MNSRSSSYKDVSIIYFVVDILHFFHIWKKVQLVVLKYTICFNV